MLGRSALALAFALATCRRDAPGPAMPAPVGDAAPLGNTAPATLHRCGAHTCAAGQLCEDLYKGHGVDADGRPLGHRLCVALPPACAHTPRCACVTRELHATHCHDDGGQVYIDDHPQPK